MTGKKPLSSEKPCLAGNCERVVVTHGYCRPHYRKLQLYGDANSPDRRFKEPKSCKTEGCRRKVACFGYCRPHWNRLQKYGDPRGGLRAERGVSLKLIGKIVKQARKGELKECVMWPYTSGTREQYGHIEYRGSWWSVNRLTLAVFTREVPEELQSAHMCGNPGCYNPWHLYWATPKQNQKDKILHGTHSAASSQRKLTEEQALRIWNSSKSSVFWAKKLGVTAANIEAIQAGKSWRWLTHTEEFKHEQERQRKLHRMARQNYKQNLP